MFGKLITCLKIRFMKWGFAKTVEILQSRTDGEIARILAATSFMRVWMILSDTPEHPFPEAIFRGGIPVTDNNRPGLSEYNNQLFAKRRELSKIDESFAKIATTGLQFLGNSLIALENDIFYDCGKKMWTELARGRDLWAEEMWNLKAQLTISEMKDHWPGPNALAPDLDFPHECVSRFLNRVESEGIAHQE